MVGSTAQVLASPAYARRSCLTQPQQPWPPPPPSAHVGHQRLAPARTTHAPPACSDKRSADLASNYLNSSGRRRPVTTCPASSSSNRSYPASTTALRGQGAVARPPSDTLTTGDTSSSPSSASASVTSATGRTWASTSGTWSDAAPWSDAARSEVFESQLDEDEGGDGGGGGSADSGHNFFAMPALPQDVVNEFEGKLEADVQTVGVTLSAILGVIIFWRGVWSLLDHLVGDSIFGDACCAVVGLCIVLYIRLSGRKIASFWPPS